MSHNWKQCVALYLEEYEELVLECYWTARSKEKMVNNRHRFFCIHCKESHKDKNTTSYHRMFRLCPVYKGTKALKMYPTWDKSEQGEKQRIGLKYGKRDSPTVPTALTPSMRPPPLNLDGDAASTDCGDAVSAVESSPPYNARLPRVHLNQSVRSSKKRNLASPSVDQRPPPPRKSTAIPDDKYEVPPPKRSKSVTPAPPEGSRSQRSLEEHHPRVSSPSEDTAPTEDNTYDSPTSQHPNDDVGFKIV